MTIWHFENLWPPTLFHVFYRKFFGPPYRRTYPKINFRILPGSNLFSEGFQFVRMYTSLLSSSSDQESMLWKIDVIKN